MKCLTIRHFKFLFVFALLLSPIFFSSGFSYALSSNTYTFDENNPARYMASTDMFPNLGFTIKYVQVEFNAPSNTKTNYMLLALINRSQSTSYFYAIPDSNGYFDVLTYVPTGVFYFQSLTGLPSSYTFTITVYDDFPSGGSSEPCPDCPEIPETPYGDKLDSIYRAILIASATMLVIYFFFAIYSMFFGGIKK